MSDYNASANISAGHTSPVKQPPKNVYIANLQFAIHESTEEDARRVMQSIANGVKGRFSAIIDWGFIKYQDGEYSGIIYTPCSPDKYIENDAFLMTDIRLADEP